MKKYFFLAIALCAGFIMTSCGDDEDTPSGPTAAKNVSLPDAPYKDDATKFEILSNTTVTIDEEDVTPKSLEVTPGGDYLLTATTETRADEEEMYLTGKVNKLGDNKYDLDGVGIFSYEKKGDSYELTFTPDGGTPYKLTAKKVDASKMEGMTGYLARTWVIQSTLLKGTIDGTQVGKAFEGPGCDMNEVIDYANKRGANVEQMKKGSIINGIVFTPSLTFMIVYKNETYDIGLWKWDNESNGFLSYHWNKADMGCEFLDTKDGKSASATVTFEGTTCKLTLKAKADKYDIEVVFTMQP